MKNKQKLLIVTIIMILVLLGLYLLNNAKKPGVKVDSSKGEFFIPPSPNNASSTPSPLNTYSSIDSLNKEKCSEVKDEKLKTLCANGIDLIEKALAAEDESLCFDKSINVDTRTRVMCASKLNNRTRSIK